MSPSCRVIVIALSLAALESAASAGEKGIGTFRVNVDANGGQADAESNAGRISISADGRFVAFDSYADNLVPNDTNGKLDVFVRDRLTGTTEIVSVDSNGVAGNDNSFFPAISADGRVVAFHSKATNLVPNDTNGKEEVFVHDRVSGVTERMNVDSNGVQGNGGAFKSAISSDGRFVTFYSYSRNLVPGDTNQKPDVFVRDRQAGTTERVSVRSDGKQGNAGSNRPSISADGRYVAFASFASNLVAGDTNATWDVFVHDRQTGTTEIVSVDSAGVHGDGPSFRPSISADGRYVAFSSEATNLVPGDTNGLEDVFVHDRATGTTKRVSVDANGNEADAASDRAALSGDGRVVAFSSSADDLVPNDSNGFSDVFVRSPYLTLEADPAVAPAGVTLTLSTFTGDPDNLVMSVIDGVNGVPMFVAIVVSTFDAQGNFAIGGTVPAGFAGNELDFITFGIISTGKVGVSNGVTVTFQ